jgi:hypothetical protein
MRLTPFRDNSSSDSNSDESTIQASTSIRVFNYDESSLISHETKTETPSTDVPPETKWAIVSLLKTCNRPVTIDELTDEIYGTDRMDDVEAWGNVHERLSRTELPALDASGTIEFHPDRGTVVLAERQRSPLWRYLSAGLFAASLGLIVAPLIFGVTTLVSLAGLFVAALGFVSVFSP